MKKMTGARYIAETLKGYDVSHVFLVMAILRKTQVEFGDLGIKRILTHGEKAAVYMADGYARISRKPGICMAQSVGAANMAAGLQDPFLAHSPVIAITGRKKPVAQYRNAYQEILHGPMYDYVTKFNANVDSAEQLPFLLCQAFREATTGAPRPVHLDILGLAGELVEQVEIGAEPALEKGQYTQYPAHRFSPESGVLKTGASMLTKGHRPVIIAGGGAVASDAGNALLRFAETFSIPVATSNDGKGIIPDNHPLSIGIVGSYSTSVTNKIVSEADVVLFVGCSTGDQVTDNWTIPRPGIPVIQIDINPSELGRSYRDALGLLGDARSTLNSLFELMKDAKRQDEWAKYAHGLVEDWKKSIAPLWNAPDIPIRPECLCHAITNSLPSDGVLVADTGFSATWANNFVFSTSPNQRFMRAAGSLGWAFPASLGVKCAAPSRPVVCFAGDGAFLYHVAELETAKRWKINTVTVVNNNSRYGQSRLGVVNAYGTGTRGGKMEDLYQFEKLNFAKIAEDFGCMGIRVESPDQLHGALKRALEADTPVVVDVVTDPSAEPPMPWSVPFK